MANSGGRRRKRGSKPKTKRSPIFAYRLEIFLVVVFFFFIAVTWSMVAERRVDQGSKTVERTAADEVQQPTQILEEEEIGQAAYPATHAALSPGKRLDFKASSVPSIGLIIDDLGADPAVAEKLLALDAPIAFSVLPHQAFSRSVALNAKNRGQVVMLHLPMEPQSKDKNPGPGALLMDHGDEKVVDAIEEAFESVPGAEGVNNHMGSRLTEDKEKMSIIMERIGARGLFFIDSRTTADSVAYITAYEMGVPTAERSVFLDNDRDVDKIVENLMTLARWATRSGSAIGIGHPYPETIQALKKALPKIKNQGVRIVPVNTLLLTPAALGTSDGLSKK